MHGTHPYASQYRSEAVPPSLGRPADTILKCRGKCRGSADHRYDRPFCGSSRTGFQYRPIPLALPPKYSALVQDNEPEERFSKFDTVDSATSLAILTKYSLEPLKLTTDDAQHVCDIV